MSDYWIALVYLTFFVVGITTPFVLTLGYVWVDTFYPQVMSDVVGLFPASMVIAVAAMLAYLSLDRRAPARFTTHTFITLAFGVWVTMTLFWAEVPDPAYDKWNWAVKTVVFSTFLPLVFRSRVQIEAFLQVFLFALTLHMLPRGIKDLLSGSGYGRNLGVINANMLLLESSTLATVSIAMIPVIMYLRKHSVLIPKSRWRDIGAFGMVGVAVLCAISTYARTALIGFIIVGVFMWWQSKRKILFAICAAVMVLGFSTITSDSWDQRIATTADYESEDSALGRILVWQWTLNYSFTHPFGGGFNAYQIDRIEFPAANGAAPLIAYGKAYHNMYIEVLGEHGYPGLFMFVALQLMSLFYLFNVARKTRGQPHLLWLYDLSRAFMVSLLTLMACGCFIGIGFQSQVWYFIALPVCLREYLYRVETLERTAPRAEVASGQYGGGKKSSGLMPMPRPRAAGNS